jgi:2,4-diaminopentanoate dehydrogenase
MVMTYKVVQWATGNVGTRSLRSVIEHPDMQLVGLYVHSKDKAGRDAGELCGVGPTGVKATNSIDDIVALRPDCVLYMQQGANIDDLCKLLAAGCNVVTTRVEFHHPPTLDAKVRERLEAACREGKTSLHSTGSSPGFSTEALPIVLASLQRRFDGMTINEFADCSSRNSPELLFQIMGFGKPLGAFNEYILAEVKTGFENSLRAFADAISQPLDKVDIEGQFAAARNQVRIAAGTVEKGTIGAQRITISGMRNGKVLMRMRLNWYITTDIAEDWDMRDSGWHIVMEGDVPLDVSIRFPIAMEHYAAMTPGLTAHRAVNAVPALCAAPPGIRTTAELTQVVARLG